MLDLHTHTNYSDGTWNLRKLLEEAEKTNIEVLSITDHNTINCYKELEKEDIIWIEGRIEEKQIVIKELVKNQR